MQCSFRLGKTVIILTNTCLKDKYSISFLDLYIIDKIIQIPKNNVCNKM